MTASEINHATLSAFLARAIAHASAVAVDAEFGLRVQHVEIERGQVRFDLDNDHIVFISLEHLVPRFPRLATSKRDRADATA